MRRLINWFTICGDLTIALIDINAGDYGLGILFLGMACFLYYTNK